MKNTRSLSYSTELTNVIHADEWKRYVKDVYGVEYDFKYGSGHIEEYFISGNKLPEKSKEILSKFVEGYYRKDISGILLSDLCHRNIIHPGKYVIKS